MIDRKAAAMDDIERANRMDILSLAGSFTTLKKIGKEHYGPCPVCRSGKDRFYVIPKNNVCGCRVCDKRWDSSGLYAAVHGLRNHDAALEMLGEKNATQREKPAFKPVEKVEVVSDVWKSNDWQAKAAAIIRESQRHTSDEFTNYTAGRGLTAETLDAFCVGFDPAKFDPKYGKTRPALVIPWMGDDQLYSVKYRFINVREGLRFISLADGNPLVFGEHQLRRHDVLIIMEGEINAMSTWQVSSAIADVVSSGADSISDQSMDYIHQLAANRGYDLIIPWYDRMSKSEAVRDRFSDFKVRPLNSPNGMDANAMHTKLGAPVLLSIIEDAIKNPDKCPYCSGRGIRILGTGKIEACMCSKKKS